MGICKLKYNEEKEILTVHLRKPGFLIGKKGITIDNLEKFLKCKVEIKEVILGRTKKK
jgi:ribosomal protein S3